MRRAMTRQGGLAAAGILVFSVLFAFHRQSPLVLDDYGFLLWLRLSPGILDKAVEQYRIWDGRLAGYVLTFSILSLPFAITNILLPLLELALICAMNMHILGIAWKERLSGRHILAVACLLWLSIPDFGQTFFWKTGSPYAIIPLLFLLFLWPYRLWAEWNEYRPRSFWLCIPLAVFCGLADFHNTVAIAFLTFALSAWTVRRTGVCRILPFISPTLLLLGFAVIYTAPGNILRIRSMYPEFLTFSTLGGMMEHLGNQGRIQAHYLWEYALFALALGLAARSGRERAAQAGFFSRFAAAAAPGGPLCMAAGFFLLAQAVQMAFMFSPSPENRAYSSSVMFMIIAALIAYSHALEQAPPGRRPLRLYWTTAAAVCLFSLAMYGGMYAETKIYADALVGQALRAGPKADLEVAPAPYLAAGRLFYGRQCSIQPDRANWINRKFSEYYGLSSIRLIEPHFELAGADADAFFQGRVEGSSLSFCYQPAKENRDAPFFLAFPEIPETSAARRAAAWLDEQAPDTFFFRYGLKTYYDRIRPETQILPEGMCGKADVRYPDRAVRGYIVHYRGSEDNAASFALLPIQQHQ